MEELRIKINNLLEEKLKEIPSDDVTSLCIFHNIILSIDPKQLIHGQPIKGFKKDKS